MTNEEKLLEFLYVAPVALIEFDQEGNVKMANPRVAQLFNRYAPGGYFANFFAFLGDFLPGLRDDIVDFSSDNGQIMENKRFCLKAPDGNESEELWMDVTIMRQESDRYIASMNNVTRQVSAENQQFMTEQRLNRLFEVMTEHVMFTMTTEGIIDSWNRTGQTYITEPEFALGKVLSQVLPIEISTNAHYLKQAATDGIVTDTLTLKDTEGKMREANICISAIHDKRDINRGFSVVLTLGEAITVN